MSAHLEWPVALERYVQRQDARNAKVGKNARPYFLDELGALRVLALRAASFALAIAAATSQAASLRLLAAELPPYSYQVPSASVAETPGPGRGVIHELVAEVARRVGQSDYIEYMPWYRAQEIAQAEPGIGILALTRSPEREDKYRWLLHLLTDDLVLVGSPGVDVSDLSKVRDRPVGVLQRSGAEALVRGLGFSRVVAEPEEWMNARLIKDRRIDAWVAPRLMVIHAMREVGGNLDVLQFGQVVRPSQLWLAASKSMSVADAKAWQDAWAAVQADGTADRIIRRNQNPRIDPVDDAKRLIQEEPFR